MAPAQHMWQPLHEAHTYIYYDTYNFGEAGMSACHHKATEVLDGCMCRHCAGIWGYGCYVPNCRYGYADEKLQLSVTTKGTKIIGRLTCVLWVYCKGKKRVHWPFYGMA